MQSGIKWYTKTSQTWRNGWNNYVWKRYISFAKLWASLLYRRRYYRKISADTSDSSQLQRKIQCRCQIIMRLFQSTEKTKQLEVKNLKNECNLRQLWQADFIPGAEPVRPNIQGFNNPKVFHAWNIPDTYKIKDFIDKEKPAQLLSAVAISELRWRKISTRLVLK